MAKTQEEIDKLREEIRSDVKTLHGKTDTISGQVSSINSKLEATLPFLATKTDVEKNMSKHVKDYHGPKSTKTMPPQQSSGIDPKLIAGLIGAATILISGLSALIQKFLTSGL